MASETDFLNGALGKAGVKRITSIDDGTPEANWCKVYYTANRRGLLGISNWKFAETRLALTQDPTAPAFEFAFAFHLIPDMVKFNEYNGLAANVVMALDFNTWFFHGGTWKIEGLRLFTNDAAVSITYIKDITNPDFWSPLFYKMFEAWLASDLAVAIRHDHGAGQRLLQEAMGVWMPEALAVDGQARSVRPYIVDDLTWGR